MDTQQKIFTLLCKRAGQSLNQRTIAKLIKASPTAVAKALKKMHHLIKAHKHPTMNLKEIELDRSKSDEKRIENLRQIIPLQHFLTENLPGTTIILFGSYSRGEDTFKSDIDIAILNSKNKRLNLNSFEKKLERNININFYKDLDIDKNLKTNICNGIVLHGSIEL